MKERPILFSGPMVRALLDGRKTQTRRVVKPQPRRVEIHGGDWLADDGRILACPYGMVGDRLWVRETWGCHVADHPRCIDGRKPNVGDKIVYRANDADAAQWDRPGEPGIGDFVWRPSIHMPRWASRITLELTEVRVERVQEISESDAIAEGCDYMEPGRLAPPAGMDWMPHDAAFQLLWDSINAKRGFGWDANPWVWALTFKVLGPLPAVPEE